MSCKQGSYLKRAKYRLTPESFRKNKFWPSKQLISSMYLYNKLYFSNWKCWNIHCSLHKCSRLGTSFPKMFLEFLKSQLAKVFCFTLTMKKQPKDMPLHPCPCSCCLDNRSGLPFPSLGDLLHSRMEPRLLHCRWILYQLSHQENPGGNYQTPAAADGLCHVEIQGQGAMC